MWKKVTFEEIAAKTNYPIGDGDHGFIKPSQYIDKGIPYIRVGDLDWFGNISEENMVYISEEVNNQNPKSHLFPGDIIIAKTGATIGKVAIIPDSMKIANTTSSIGKITLDTTVAYPKFILLYMQTKEFQKEIWAVSHKSAQPGFNIINLKKFKVPLPPLTIQLQIANILSNSQRLIQQRKDGINLIDDFLKSTFLKMFFQYFPKGNTKKLETLCTKITDGTHDTPERLKEGIKFITGKHIRPYVIDFDNSDYVTQEVHNEIYRRCNPEFGDILYTNIGVNLGTAAMNSVDYEFSMKNVALLKIKSDLITSRYLEHLLNLPSRRNRILNNNSSGGAQQFLSLGQIKNIDIPVPPIEVQKLFSEIVEKSEKLKTQFKSSLNELENLYGSLCQKAFKGDLDLSKVEIDDEWHNFDGNKPEEKDPAKRAEIKQFFEDQLKKNEDGNFDQPIGDPFAVDEGTARKQGKQFYEEWKKLHPVKKKSKITWEKVSTQQAANWIKEKYSGYHFTSEMLIRFLMDEYVTFPDYYSSEELKKYPQTNEADDLKSLIFSAVSKQNPYLKLEQVFYNAEEENIQIKITEEDYELIKERFPKNRSGIYFTIAE